MARETDEHNEMISTHDIVESLEDNLDIVDFEVEEDDEDDVYETMGNEMFDGEDNNEDDI